MLLLVATLLPWAREGTGSTIAAREVGDLLLSGTVATWAPTWLGFCVYLVPVAGALLLIGCGLGGRLGRTVAAGSLLLALVVTVTTTAALPHPGGLNLGTGAVVALLGVGLGAVSIGCSLGRLHPIRQIS